MLPTFRESESSVVTATASHCVYSSASVLRLREALVPLVLPQLAERLRATQSDTLQLDRHEVHQLCHAFSCVTQTCVYLVLAKAETEQLLVRIMFDPTSIAPLTALPDPDGRTDPLRGYVLAWCDNGFVTVLCKHESDAARAAAAGRKKKRVFDETGCGCVGEFGARCTKQSGCRCASTSHKCNSRCHKDSFCSNFFSTPRFKQYKAQLAGAGAPNAAAAAAATAVVEAAAAAVAAAAAAAVTSQLD